MNVADDSTAVPVDTLCGRQRMQISTVCCFIAVSISFMHDLSRE